MFNIFRPKKKKFERDAGFYDNMYRSGGHLGQYNVHYTESRYFPVWRRGADIICTIENPCVLDIGCGPGQFAQILFDRGISTYHGIDHSAVAIDLAQKNVPEWAENFTVADIHEMSTFPEGFNIVVMFEVLEHLERDIDLLGFIPSGKTVLFSVPSFGGPSHVRQFKTIRMVKKRYAPVIDIIELESFTDCPEPEKTIFIVHGTVKPY